jgi:integral membrane protein (TIGR01906 family)
MTDRADEMPVKDTSPGFLTLSPRQLAGLRLVIVIAIPVILTLLSVRVVMTPLFLNIEYNRAGFPLDRYGFTTDDRLEYAPYALNYLFNSADIDYLGNLTFPDGQPLFNNRELSHMADVKVVTRAAFLLLLIGGGLTVVMVALMSRSAAGRAELRSGILGGGLLTLGIIGVIVVLAVVAWDTFFTGFHQMFFSGDTWIFAYSDTLIRLFPEQFWFDASLTVGTLTGLGALILAGTAWQWTRIAAR